QRQRCRCSPDELACRKHGDPSPLSRPATQLAEIMAKVDRPCGFRLAGDAAFPQSWSARIRLTRNCSSTNHFRSLSEHRFARIDDRTIAELAALLPCSLRLAA